MQSQYGVIIVFKLLMISFHVFYKYIKICRNTNNLQNIVTVGVYNEKNKIETKTIIYNEIVDIFQLLRRMLDDRILCTLQRPFEWRTIEGLQVCSTMSMSEYPSMNDRILAPRLLVSITQLGFETLNLSSDLFQDDIYNFLAANQKLHTISRFFNILWFQIFRFLYTQC